MFFLRQICAKTNIFYRQTIANNFPCISQLLPNHVQQTFYSNATPTPYEIVDEKKDNKLVKEVINKVNSQVAQAKHGRLFAVVHIAGKQHKITQDDVIVIEGYWPPECGEKISLDKVLLIGATDFTLIGRPVLQKGVVKVTATVIEKTLSHTKTHFKKKRRKQYMRINFVRVPQTFVRINTIEILCDINNPPEVTGLETAVF